jgi:hypothetical protein
MTSFVLTLTAAGMSPSARDPVVRGLPRLGFFFYDVATDATGSGELLPTLGSCATTIVFSIAATDPSGVHARTESPLCQ